MTACSRPSANSGPNSVWSERLPATRPTARELVLLPGWSTDSTLWRCLLPRLRPLANVTLIDLPGSGRSGPGSYDEPVLLDAIAAVAPQRAVYLGWSLGGMLALALARRCPARVQAVVSLAANASFVQRDGWSEAASEEQFQQFRARVAARGRRALSRFDALQCRGVSEADALLRQCRRLRETAVAPAQLTDGLDLLMRLDLRGDLQEITQPVVHLLGDADALVPVAVAGRLKENYPRQRTVVLPGHGHLLPLTAEQEIVKALRSLLTQIATPSGGVVRDKREVARGFGAAAGSYDGVAQLQRDIGAELLRALPAERRFDRVLDLGCGTGYFREHLQARGAQRYTGLDLAEGMIRQARLCRSAPGARWLVGDAENLPLASASQDLVFSNLAIQWCENLPALFAEIRRILRPGGRALLATLGSGTLEELRQAWVAVDEYDHVNRFTDAAELDRTLARADFARCEHWQEVRQVQYAQVVDLLRELKALGAHNVNAGRPRGMLGRRALSGLVTAYETFRRDGLLPATYQVHYLRLEVPDA